MLNISDNSVEHLLKGEDLSCMKRNMEMTSAHHLLRNWLAGLLLVTIAILFLPWQQNIQSSGQLTTLNPQHRPQTIHSTIAGRIEKWYVKEGDLVKKGDTIAYLSEIKTEYFDTDLLARTQNQVKAKEGAIGAYDSKVQALDDQVAAMRQELELKKSQLEAKVRQADLKLTTARADYQQAKVALDIARIQLQRADTLYRQGIEPRQELENKQQKLQEAQAKAVYSENKVQESDNELKVTRLELSNVTNEYNSKIAKALSDRFSTVSDMYNAEGELNKTRIQYENYAQRSQYYYIVAPQDCYITKAIKPGIGETVKEGDAIVSIMPADFAIAAELYIRPMDLPLIEMGSEVRFIFDGWPAFVFSGWPNQSVGTYKGKIVAIDNTVNEKGEYRILAAADPSDRPWPDALRPGSGARGIALLDHVPVWYEIWRKLNGFPPDYYQREEEEGKQDDKKTKLGDAPAKSLAK